jgi:hypothetical protein
MQKVQRKRSIKLITAVAAMSGTLLATAFVDLAEANPTTHETLTAISGQGSGEVSVSPTAKNEGTNLFDGQVTINIHGTAPGTVFTVSRNPDFNADGICTGSSFVPFAPALTTSAGGAGAVHYEVLRGLPNFPEGVTFDVSFRAVGTDGTVLTSECFTVTGK